MTVVTNTELPQFYCSNYNCNCGILVETMVAKVNFS